MPLAASFLVCRTGTNEIKDEKANRSQIGDQISQKYLPSVPLTMGTIEQTRKLREENAPTIYRAHRTWKKCRTVGRRAIPATIISKFPAHTKNRLKAMTAMKGNEYKAMPTVCVRGEAFMTENQCPRAGGLKVNCVQITLPWFLLHRSMTGISFPMWLRLCLFVMVRQDH